MFNINYLFASTFVMLHENRAMSYWTSVDNRRSIRVGLEVRNESVFRLLKASDGSASSFTCDLCWAGHEEFAW